MRAAIYQVFFDGKSRALLDPGFLPYDNTGRLTDYYENSVILDVHSEPAMWRGFDYVGVVSWRFAEKTGLTAPVLFGEMSRKSPDVFLMTPRMYAGFDAPYSRRGFRSVQELAKVIDRNGVLPYELYDYDAGDVLNFCNFWAARPGVFDDYCRNYLSKVMDFVENGDDPELASWRLKRVEHRGRPHPPAVFLIEGLFQTYVHYTGLDYEYVRFEPMLTKYRANSAYRWTSRNK